MPRALKKISNFLTPDKFYVAFPHGVYEPKVLMRKRTIISSNTKFCLQYENQTIKDGKRLGFTFTWEDVKKINAHIQLEGTGRWKAIGKFIKGKNYEWSHQLPAEEQYSARHFTLEKVFEPLDFFEAEKIDLSWFFDIKTWEGYKEFMGSEYCLKRPVPLARRKLPLIGVDDD